MKPAPFEYFRAGGLQEAVALLHDRGSEAKLLAGGQSLVPLMNLRLARPDSLIDLNPAKDLAYVREQNGAIAIGAMTRHHQVATSDLVRDRSPMLAAAAANIGFPAIRHRGTIGGSCAHADPAAEMPLLAVALQAEFVATSSRGVRRLPADGFFISHFTTALEPDEVLSEVMFPKPPEGVGWAFEELSRKAGDFAIVSVAVQVSAPNGKIGRLDVALAGAAERPLKVPTGAWSGRDLDENLCGEVAEKAGQMVVAASDIHGTREFRAQIVRVLTERALRRAVAMLEKI
ncbi:MAG: FAD binding domain-containing protein [Candidatus Acidiferrales bacterium]